MNRYLKVGSVAAIIFMFTFNPSFSQSSFTANDGIYLDKIAGVNFNFMVSNTSDSVKIRFENVASLANQKIVVMKSYNGSYFSAIYEEIISSNPVISFTSSKSTDKTLSYKILLQQATGGTTVDSSKIITVFGATRSKCTIYLSKTKGEVLADLDPSLKGHMPRVIVTDANTGEVLLSKAATEVKQTDKFKVVSGKDKLSPGTYNVSLAFKRETFSQKIEVR
jgi:hypothetical protein